MITTWWTGWLGFFRRRPRDRIEFHDRFGERVGGGLLRSNSLFPTVLKLFTI